MKQLRVIAGMSVALVLLATSCKDEKKEDTVVLTETDTVSVTPPVDTVMTLNRGRVTVTKEEMPAATTTAFTKKVPAATNVRYSRMAKLNNAGSDSIVYYYIDYDLDNYSYWLVYDDQGKIVEDNSYQKITGLPDPVSRSIAEYFPGYTVTEIDKDNDKDLVQYEVQMEKGEMKRKVKFLADGGMYKIK